MKNYGSLLLLITYFSTAFGQPNWKQKTNYPDSISNAVGFSIGSMGYVGLGWNRKPTRDFHTYDPATNSWSKIADFPSANCYNPVAFSANGEGYVGTGYDDNSNFLKHFWKYNAQKDTWTKIKDFEGVARSEVSCFEINGKGYVGLGWDGTNYLKDMWEYTPSTDSWKKIANFPGTARISATGFSIRGKGYICSGLALGWNYLNDLWAYDPQKDTWEQKATFPADKRMRACAFVIDDQGVFGSGVNNTRRYNDFWKYDPRTNQWTKLDTLSTGGRQEAVAIAINNKGYIGTGHDLGFPYYNDFWEFSLASGTGQCNPKPKASFTVKDVCETDSAAFINNSENALTYLWKFGNGKSSTLKSPKHSYSIGGVSWTYNVTLVASVSGTCSDSVTHAVTINANPNSNFTYSDKKRLVEFKPEKADLTSYTWHFENGDSVTTPNAVYEYPEYGKYTACLKVTNFSGCSSKTCQQIYLPKYTGISPNTKPITLQLIPNPNSGKFTLVKSQPGQCLGIVILNALGQSIHHMELMEDITLIDLDLDSGIYLLRVLSGEVQQCERLMITKQ